MEKGDSFSFCSHARLVIDQLDSPRPAACEGVVQIVDGKTNVMNAWSAAIDESRDRGVGGVGLEQLDERVAGRETGNVSTIRVLERNVVEAKEISIEWKQLVDRAYGDSNVRNARSTTSGGWHENRAPYVV